MRKRPKKSERRPADRAYPKPQSQTPSGSTPNPKARPRPAPRLGCAHAHVLIEGVKVALSDEAKAVGKTFPESFGDYAVNNTWTAENLPKGIKLHLRHAGPDAVIGPRQS